MLGIRTKTTPETPRERAERRFGEIVGHFLTVEKLVIDIIADEDWKELGHPTLYSAWAERVSPHTRLGAALIPHVVYQMLAEGHDNDDIADAVGGVGPETAQRLREQRDHGVPVDMATTVVRRHHRRPRTRVWLRAEVDAARMAEWDRLAKAVDRTVPEIALEATAAAFDRLRDDMPR